MRIPFKVVVDNQNYDGYVNIPIHILNNVDSIQLHQLIKQIKQNVLNEFINNNLNDTEINYKLNLRN